MNANNQEPSPVKAISRRWYMLLSATVIVIVSAWAVEFFLTSTSERPFGHTQIAHLVGWIGLILIALVFVYPVKRRLHPNELWPKQWFEIHQICGIVGPVIIFLHSGFHFHAIVPVLALVTMTLVVMSGITGQALHYYAFQTLYDRRHELTAQGLSPEAVESRLHELALQEETLRWWSCVHGPLTFSFVAFSLSHIGGALYFGGL